MYIKVIHRAFEDTPYTAAVVDCPTDNMLEACEYAYRWTPNIMDSWSKNGPVTFFLLLNNKMLL